MPQKSGELTAIQLPIGVDLDTVDLAQSPKYSPRVENVILHKRSIRARLGETPYIDKSFLNIQWSILGMHRYRNADGTKKVLAHTNGSIVGDSDNGQFTSLTSTTANGDGYIDFEQYRSSVSISSELANPQWYNSSAGTIAPTLAPIPFHDGLASLSATPATTGGFLPDKKFVWRVTFDIKHGNDFLGETQASGLKSTTPPGYQQFESYYADWSGGANNDNKITFLRSTNAIIDAIPSYVTAVNFYRSPPLDSFPRGTMFDGTVLDEITDLYWIGSVSMASIRLLNATDPIFVDDGLVDLGKQISHGVRWYPIRARHQEIHKGRLWLTNCNVADNATSATYAADIDSIYCSRFGLDPFRPQEPIVFQMAMPKFEVDPYSGEGTTGLASWKGKVLLAFKPNSTMAFVGGDDSISDNIPIIQKEILSPTVGCIAPRTIVKAEGAVLWVSHRGPEIFDGTGPKPLNMEKVRPFFDLIPATRKRKMVAYYDSRDREYVIFYTHIAELTTNRRAFRYSFVTGEWTLDKFERGIGSVLEVNNSDMQRRLLYGYDDLNTYFNTFDNDPIIVFGKAGNKSGTAAQEPISWFVKLPPNPFGDHAFSKTLAELWVTGQWVDTVYASFVIWHKDGVRDLSGSPVPLPNPDNGAGTVMIAKQLPVGVSGTHIQVILSGITSAGQCDITNVSCALTPIGRV